MSSTVWNRRRAMHDHDTPVNARSMRPPLPPAKAAKLRNACAEALKDSNHRPRQSRETNKLPQPKPAEDSVRAKKVEYEPIAQASAYPTLPKKPRTAEPSAAKPSPASTMIPQPIRTTPTMVESVHPAHRTEHTSQATKLSSGGKGVAQTSALTSPPGGGRSKLPRRARARASSPLLGIWTSGFASPPRLAPVVEPSRQIPSETPEPRISVLRDSAKKPVDSVFNTPEWLVEPVSTSRSKRISSLKPETQSQGWPSGSIPEGFETHIPPPLFSGASSRLPVAKTSTVTNQRTPDRFFRPSNRSLQRASNPLLPSVSRVEDSLTSIEDKKAELTRLEWQIKEVTARLDRVQLVNHRRRRRVNSAGVRSILKPVRDAKEGNDGKDKPESERAADPVTTKSGATVVNYSRPQERTPRKTPPIAHKYKSSLSSTRSPRRGSRRVSAAPGHRYHPSISSLGIEERLGIEEPSSTTAEVATDDQHTESERVSMIDFTPSDSVSRNIARHSRVSSIVTPKTRVSDVPSLLETAVATRVPYRSARAGGQGVAVVEIHNPNHTTIRVVPNSSPTYQEETEQEWEDEEDADDNTFREEVETSSLQTEDLEQDFGNLRGWRTRSEWTPSPSSGGIHYRMPSRSSPYPLRQTMPILSPARQYSRLRKKPSVIRPSPPRMTLYPGVSPVTPQSIRQGYGSEPSSDPSSLTPDSPSHRMWRVHNPDMPSRDSRRTLATLEEFPDIGQSAHTTMNDARPQTPKPPTPKPAAPSGNKISGFFQPSRVSRHTPEPPAENRHSSVTQPDSRPLPKGRFRTWLRRITPTAVKLRHSSAPAKSAVLSKALTPVKPAGPPVLIKRSDSVLQFEQSLLRELGLPASKSRRASAASSAKKIVQEVARQTYTEGMPFSNGASRLSRSNLMSSPSKAGHTTYKRPVPPPLHSRHSTRSTFRYSFGSAPSLSFPNFPVPAPQLNCRPPQPVNYCRKPSKHCYNPSVNSNSMHSGEFIETVIQPF